MITTIIFSKNRPLQLDAYIGSLIYYSGLKETSITVLYAHDEGYSYEHIIKRFPDVKWVKETAFQSDLRDLLKNAEQYVLLGCDDVIFTGTFEANEAIATLETDSDIFGFSLRLGTNIKFMPSLLQINLLGIFTWDWRKARDSYWRYAWDVSGSIYRRDFVYNYLNSRDDITNPNRFEDYLAKEIQSNHDIIPSKLACFENSKTITITINRVQDEYENAFDASKILTDPQNLNNLYQTGQRQDWPAQHNIRNRSVHVGAEYFDLTGDLVEPDSAFITSVKSSKKSHTKASFGFYLRIVFWAIAIRVWEHLRPIIPRSILAKITERLIRAK